MMKVEAIQIYMLNGSMGLVSSNGRRVEFLYALRGRSENLFK
jgi:hypothetical protein